MAKQISLNELYEKRLKKSLSKAPFIVRITEWKDHPIPVVVIKERTSKDSDERSSLQDRGVIKGSAIRQILPFMKRACSHIVDENGVPTDVERFFTNEGMKFRGSLPLDEEAGAKLGLMTKLLERLNDAERSELLARRILNFSREEALYWLSRITDFGPDAGRWAVSGLRLMLAGPNKDKATTEMLQSMQTK